MTILSIPPWGHTLKCAASICDILELEPDCLVSLAHF